MMIVMTPHATPEQIESVLDHVKTEGLPAASLGRQGADGDRRSRDRRPRRGSAPVRGARRRGEGGAACRPRSSWRRASSRKRTRSSTSEKGVKVGGREVVLMAGPCTIESKEQVEAIAPIVAAAGARIMRGGAFKPRTSPYSFQGMGEEGLKFLRDAADRYNLLIVSEVMDRSQIEMMLRYVDILQVGARNMQNFDLLKDLGKVQRPGPAQARHRRDPAGAAARRRVHHGGRQQAGDPVRARHPHLRDLDAQHARHLGHPGRQGDVAPADRRRSEPLDGHCATWWRRWRARRSQPAPTA